MKITKLQGMTAQAVIGVYSGYNHTNKGVDGREVSTAQFVGVVMAAAEVIFGGTGIYISSVVQPVRVVYRTEWGCPAEGEFAYSVEAVCNPSYKNEGQTVEEYMDAWQQAFERLIEFILTAYGQSTGTISFSSSEGTDVVYLQKE